MHPDFASLLPLGGDERFELLRGHRAHSASAVLVKRPRRPGPADAAALQRELAVLADSAGAATLLPRQLDMLLVMEDPGGALLPARPSAGLPIDAVLAIGQQLAEALGVLHRRGLVHHGLRPAAVLWCVERRSAWIVDHADAGPPGFRTSPRLDAARLTYLAPEQTGRLDSGTDARSDLYALGVLLYELLTGAPPFRSDDALELIHAHIAVAPRAPVSVNAAVPPVLSALVMKLLAKAPEDRYQSARGLARDLSACAQEWRAHGRIAPFAPGRHDVGESLRISPRLMGREAELQTMRAAFERARLGTGGAALLLVEGYAGIGKTALIQQLYRPIVQHSGYFISGKFDQLVRGVPFDALIQAFRGLVRQMLTESEGRLAAWRSTMRQALGSNGGVLAEVMPEIEFIIGPQAAPVALGSTESQNRFQRVLQSFLAALATPEHPLVLFLDDLQWADAATLALLEPMLTSGDTGNLLVIGAYRDQEADAAPRLLPTLAALAGAGVALQRVTLGPLQLPELTQLVADSLHGGLDHAAPLARLVLQKTGGNPFFVIQFLKSLERDGHLQFDPEQGRWDYRIETLAAAPLADNVVDLMTRQIQRLSPRSQYALTLAACMGNRFERQTLAIVSEQSLAATEADLAEAREAGLVLNVGDEDACTFLHDRVQQAAYALIPADRRRMVHLTVGRLLRARTAPEQQDAALFDVVHHLNLGRELITDGAERRAVAGLNLAAGRRAKTATAHDAALELFDAGLSLVDEDSWLLDRGFCFELQLEAAESRYLCGRFDAALAAQTALLARARTPIEQARVLRLRSVQFENMARYAESLAASREALAPFGVQLPDALADKTAALEAEIAHIGQLRGGREIASLVDLPDRHDEATRMVMSMLTDMWSAAYILGDPTLARLISATLVRLSLQHGNAPESAYGYVTHAITVAAVHGDYREAHAYGLLALAVNQRLDDTRRRAKIYQQFHAHVNFWCEPLRTCLPYARQACRSGLDSGDFLYAAYGAATEPWAAIAATQDLAQFVAEYTPSVALIEKLNNTGFADGVRVILAFARALQGAGTRPPSLSDAEFDEDDWLQRYSAQPFFGSIHAVMRLQLCVLLGTPEQALEAAQHSARLMPHVMGTLWPVIHEFWHGLALAGSVHGARPERRAEVLAEVRLAQQAFAARAGFCAENFLCPSLLLAAELQAAEGDWERAIALCEEAIEFAAGRPLVMYEALAHERAARWRQCAEQPSLAALHRSRSQALYTRWGARAKALTVVPSGERRPPEPAVALRALAPDDTAAGATGGADGLDYASVLKAAQAIAGETGMEQLLPRLLHIAVENAGAERGALVLEVESGPQVFTEGGSGQPLERSEQVPVGIVNYVRRTGEPVVLARAAADVTWAGDPYLQRHRPCSLACLPVGRQGRLLAVLVLEHRHLAAAFTPARQHTLQVLATQAAISLENARLVQGLQGQIVEREQAQRQLAAALSRVQQLSADLEAENSYLRRDLIANVSHDLRTPLAAMRGYLDVLASRGDMLSQEQRRQYLGVAVRQSEHMATLIEELFELAKLDFRGVVLQREPFSFCDLASDVMQKFQLDAQARQVTLVVEAPADLPLVDADLSLIERVLDNLIANALRHTPADGRVRVRTWTEGAVLVAQVSDTGCGIAAADLPHVFDRFYRGRGQRAGGAGLGLAITKRILDLHDASVQVDSAEGRGTCFTFRLPSAAPRSVA